MRELGRIVRLQIQRSSLKTGEKPNRVYDPARLLTVAHLAIGPDGVLGQADDGAWLVDVHHRAHPDTKNEDRTLMLRTLLEDRFKLAVHRQSKEIPGYVLVVGKKFKLKPVEPGGSGTDSHGGRVRTLTATKTSMAFLADLIARNLGETVVDKTGIDGVYDFELRWTNDDQATDADSAPTLFTALEETLGLRLQRQKVPVEIVVVDHAERAPTEN